MKKILVIISILVAVGVYFILSPTQNPMLEKGISDPNQIQISWQDYNAFWQNTSTNTLNIKGYKNSISPTLHAYYNHTYKDINTPLKASAELVPFLTSYKHLIDKNSIQKQDIVSIYQKILDYAPSAKLPKQIIFIVGAFDKDIGITEDSIIVPTELFYKGHKNTILWDLLPYTPEHTNTFTHIDYPYTPNKQGILDAITYATIHYLQAQNDTSLDAYESKRHAPQGIKVRYPIVYEGVAELLQFILTGRESDRVIAGDIFADKTGNGGFGTQYTMLYRKSHNDDQATMSRYMHTRTPEQNRPVDYGHWLGYRIAKNYWWRQQNKQQAVQDLISPKNADKIFQSAVYTSTIR